MPGIDDALSLDSIEAQLQDVERELEANDDALHDVLRERDQVLDTVRLVQDWQ